MVPKLERPLWYQSSEDQGAGGYKAGFLNLKGRPPGIFWSKSPGGQGGISGFRTRLHISIYIICHR
jgi:hypothetical protein